MTLSKFRRVLSLPIYDQWNRVRLGFYRLKGALFYRWIFASFGKRSAIFPAMMISNPRFIRIGDGVTIQKGARLEAVLIDPENPPEIKIGNNVNIEQDVHISAVGKIHIHDNVGIGARCTLLCSAHPFFDVHDPVKISARIDGAKSLIEIGHNSLLGIGSVIHMNVRLGEHVVVGANSVVKKSFPGYNVIDGHPATVVLTYDAQQERWVRPAKKAEQKELISPDSN
jgi:acetyltransferase-like isoleucine patch superfamily enzyme